MRLIGKVKSCDNLFVTTTYASKLNGAGLGVVDQ
jgi:hypothetical protein